jgi:hypothetical protein
MSFNSSNYYIKGLGVLGASVDLAVWLGWPLPAHSFLFNLLLYRSYRYAACRIFSDAGLSYCVWAEDALLSYDVPTVVFDLFLLVREPIEAAEKLQAAGYARAIPNPRYLDIPQFSDRFSPKCLLERENEPCKESEQFKLADPAFTAVILLPA